MKRLVLESPQKVSEQKIRDIDSRNIARRLVAHRHGPLLPLATAPETPTTLRRRVNRAQGHHLLDVAFPADVGAIVTVPFGEGRRFWVGPRGARNTLFLFGIPSILELALVAALVQSLPRPDLCGRLQRQKVRAATDRDRL